MAGPNRVFRLITLYLFWIVPSQRLADNNEGFRQWRTLRIDVVKQIGALTRLVGFGERNGDPARIQVATRLYDTDQDNLWDALTNIDQIPKWFSADFRRPVPSSATNLS